MDRSGVVLTAGLKEWTASVPPLRAFGHPVWLDRVRAAIDGSAQFWPSLKADTIGSAAIPAFSQVFDIGMCQWLSGWRIGAAYHTDYLDFPDMSRVEAGDVASLLQAADHENCDYVLFSNLVRSTALAHELGILARSGAVERLNCTPTLGVDTSSLTFADWWASRGAGTRRRLKRYCRRLREAEAVLAIEPATSANLATFLDLQAARAGMTGLDAFSCEASLVALILSLEDMPGACMATLRISGSCRAALLLLDDGEAVGVYGQGFDPAIEKLSPGVALFCHVVEEAFAGRWSYVDFLRGDESYKDSWANCRVEMDKYVWLSPRAQTTARAFFGDLVE